MYGGISFQPQIMSDVNYENQEDKRWEQLHRQGTENSKRWKRDLPKDEVDLREDPKSHTFRPNANRSPLATRK